MIDICFSETLAAFLEEFKPSINSEGVLFLGLHLNYGRLDCDIFEEQAKREAETLVYCYDGVTKEELHEEYEDLLSENIDAQEALERCFKENKDMRLWLSNNASDRCGLFWFCNFAKNYSNRVFTVVCPGYSCNIPDHRPYEVRNWAFIEPEYFPYYAKQLRPLENDEMLAYSETWQRMVKENAELRILIDDTIVGVEEDFFDRTILGFVSHEPQTQYSIMGKMLGKWQGGCDAAFISKRIEHLIDSDIIKVCTEDVDEEDCYWQRTIALK